MSPALACLKIVIRETANHTANSLAVGVCLPVRSDPRWITVCIGPASPCSQRFDNTRIPDARGGHPRLRGDAPISWSGAHLGTEKMLLAPVDPERCARTMPFLAHSKSAARHSQVLRGLVGATTIRGCPWRHQRWTRGSDPRSTTGRRTHTDTSKIYVIVNGEHALLDCYEHRTGCTTIGPGKHYGQSDGGSIWINYRTPLTHKPLRNHYAIAGSWRSPLSNWRSDRR